jgi:hypothetical protein
MRWFLISSVIIRGQNYKKTRAEQKNSFIFMPRWRYFAIEDDKVTKKFGLFLKNYCPLTSLTSLSFLTSHFFRIFAKIR